MACREGSGHSKQMTVDAMVADLSMWGVVSCKSCKLLFSGLTYQIDDDVWVHVDYQNMQMKQIAYSSLTMVVGNPVLHLQVHFDLILNRIYHRIYLHNRQMETLTRNKEAEALTLHVGAG